MHVIYMFMLQFHWTQNPSCIIAERNLFAEVVASPQLMQVSGSDIVAMGGIVVQGFHFFMVALQNGTVLQVSACSVCLCVEGRGMHGGMLVDMAHSESIMAPHSSRA